jgi:hypothetical protein
MITLTNDEVGWLPALGTRGFHRPLSDPRADLRLRFHGSERDGRNARSGHLDAGIVMDRLREPPFKAIKAFIALRRAPAYDAVCPC